MAELADALDLGSSEETRTGSIPARCTKTSRLRQSCNAKYYLDIIVAFYLRHLNNLIVVSQSMKHIDYHFM